MLLIGSVGTQTSVERWAMVWRDVGVGWMGVPHSGWGLVREWWLLPGQ